MPLSARYVIDLVQLTSMIREAYGCKIPLHPDVVVNAMGHLFDAESAEAHRRIHTEMCTSEEFQNDPIF